MKFTLLASFIVTCLPCDAQQSKPEIVSSTSVASIGKHFAAKKAAALEAYLAAKPDAGDALMVMRQLEWSYREMGDTARQLATLEKQYAAMPKGANGELSLAFENIFSRFCLHRGNNNAAVLEKAFTAIEQGQKDFPAFAESNYGPQFDSLLAKLKLHTIGSPVEIAFTALDGSKVDISTMKNKVVLVIYVESSPDPDDLAMLRQVKAAYEKLHDKGFEVIGLSLGKDRASLESFVKKERIPWPQAYDSQGWDYALAVRLTVNTLPFNFLVGKDGKMALRHVRGDDLGAKVMELLK